MGKHTTRYILLANLLFFSACGAQTQPKGQQVYNFEECAALGYLVLKTDPPKCRTPDGRIYTGIKGYSEQVIAQHVAENIMNFEECVAKGFPVQKSLPPKCTAPDGQTYIQGKGTGAGNHPPTDGALNPSLCIDQCGNGTCEEIVCMAQGCPCPESATTCPKDCH